MPDVKSLMYLPTFQDHVMVYSNLDNQDQVNLLKMVKFKETG